MTAVEVDDTPGPQAEAVTVQVLTIGPDMAREWLKKNPQNRKLRAGFVAQLANAIRRGEWQLNGESIKLSADGTLVDGQHRLAAIAEADSPVQALVVQGIPIESLRTVDMGVRRTLGDYLKMTGERNVANLASALSALHIIRNGGWRSSKDNYPTIDQAITLLETDPGIRDWIVLGVTLNRDLRYPPSLATAIAYETAQRRKAQTEYFWERLAGGYGLDQGDPIWQLRRWIERMHTRNERMSKGQVAGMTIVAWNNYLSSEKGPLSYSHNLDDFPRPL